MERFNSRTEPLRFPSDFVQGGKPIEGVESRVFDSLGHDRTGVLLKLEHEMGMFGLRFVLEVFGETEQQQVAQKVENGFFYGWVTPLGRGDRALNDVSIFL